MRQNKTNCYRKQKAINRHRRADEQIRKETLTQRLERERLDQRHVGELERLGDGASGGEVRGEGDGGDVGVAGVCPAVPQMNVRRIARLVSRRGASRCRRVGRLLLLLLATVHVRVHLLGGGASMVWRDAGARLPLASAPFARGVRSVALRLR